MARGSLTDPDIEILKTYTAQMYGAKGKVMSLNYHRYNVFEKAYGPKARSWNALAKLQGIDGSMIPPCESEISQHIKRSSFVAKIWANADLSELNQHPSSNDGWELHEEQYEIIWFDGQQLPESMVPEEEDHSHQESSDDDLNVSSSDEDGLSSDED